MGLFLQPQLAVGNFNQIIFGGATSTYNSATLTFQSNSTPSLSALYLGVYGNSFALGVNGNGNVGIGTTSPGATLEVNGSLKLTASSGGSITFQDGTTQTTAYTGATCGGDYAESMNVTGERIAYAPGDVLVLDTDNPGKILKSIEPYSTAVAGIYSTKPGTRGAPAVDAPKRHGSSHGDARRRYPPK